MDHFGLLAPLASACLARNLAVLGLDLPGHGLSSGERAAISDFTQYRQALETAVEACMETRAGSGDRLLPRPLFAAGHSTGCSVLLEHLRVSPAPAFSRMAFLAPLVRFPCFRLNRPLAALASLVTAGFPRRFTPAGGSEDFLRFQLADPLIGRRMALKWARAVYPWERRLRSMPSKDIPLLIVQGDADPVVDWRRNLPFLQKKFLNSKVLLLPGAKHQLVGEKEPLRSRAVLSAADFLTEPL
jgi:alpha-beta hydrolase superfamily lysophospholipase